MPDKMTIRIKVNDANQTVSRFAVDDKGQVTLYNDASADVNVKFDGVSPLCTGNDPQESIDILAGKHEVYKVCDGSGGQEFKYTAVVAGADPEDPIIFVERVLTPGGGVFTNPIFFVEVVGGITAAAIVGGFIGYRIAKRRFMLKQ